MESDGIGAVGRYRKRPFPFYGKVGFGIIPKNFVEAGFVWRQEDWLYSSAIDYNGGKGLLPILFLDVLVLYLFRKRHKYAGAKSVAAYLRQGWGTAGNPMQDIIRDLKRHTSEELHKVIAENKTESRREWLLWMMERAGKKNGNNGSFQLWQQHNQPIELRDNKMAHQKLEYLHYNPVEAGFVWRQEDWLYSRAIDYNEGKGLLPTLFLDLLIL